MMRKDGLGVFPEYIRGRFIPLAMLGIDSRIPQVEDGSLVKAYIYNICVTLCFPWILTSSRLVGVTVLCSQYLTSIVVRTRNFLQYIGVLTAHWS